MEAQFQSKTKSTSQQKLPPAREAVAGKSESVQKCMGKVTWAQKIFIEFIIEKLVSQLLDLPFQVESCSDGNRIYGLITSIFLPAPNDSPVWIPEFLYPVVEFSAHSQHVNLKQIFKLKKEPMVSKSQKSSSQYVIQSRSRNAQQPCFPESYFCQATIYIIKVNHLMGQVHKFRHTKGEDNIASEREETTAFAGKLLWWEVLNIQIPEPNKAGTGWDFLF